MEENNNVINYMKMSCTPTVLGNSHILDIPVNSEICSTEMVYKGNRCLLVAKSIIT